jgi:hypothetical protein
MATVVSERVLALTRSPESLVDNVNPTGMSLLNATSATTSTTARLAVRSALIVATTARVISDAPEPVVASATKATGVTIVRTSAPSEPTASATPQ